MVRSIRSLTIALALALQAAALLAQTPDPAALRREIEQSRLDPVRAVTLKGLKLDTGLADLLLEDGVLLPATPVGGKTTELVYLGKGRITVDPPDAIEASQLEIFTGSPRMEEEFTEMVLVLGLDAAADAMLRKPKAPELDPTLNGRAHRIYATWKGSPERKLLNVEEAMLKDAVGDSAYQGFFAAWFHGKELGDFLYLVEPDAQEQVTLGHFVPMEATEREKRKILRQLNREQRRGRLIGVELEDLGQWDTWLSASLRRSGKPVPGRESFEPEKYTLDVTLAERGLELRARARLDLKPAVRGARSVALRLNSDLRVDKVTDGSGAGLFFSRSGRDLTVILPRPPADEEKIALVVEYSGSLVEKEGGNFALLDTEEWYPHTGTLDRAPYDVTFHWPKRLDLLACGRRVDGGESGGMRWERRTLDIPVFNFAFEIGRYRIETTRAGHVEVKLAFNPEVTSMGKEAREEIAKTVTDSLLFFEEQFGPYPLDELTVVTVPRDFSQAMLGFVTLSSFMMLDLDAWNLLFGLEDRRTVIAHEISHQWWGHRVGWTSYRDQWISEAMANYASLLYARKKLDFKGRYGLGPTTGWQDALTDTTADGRVIESLGPVVLGQRLLSSRSDTAYQAIVYHKGAVILDMLARALGEENFPKIMTQIAKVAEYRPISTEDFLSLIERITSADLDGFAEQFVYGTGLPEVYYSYHLEPKGDGKWVVKGEARQQAPYRFRYRVVKTAAGRFDVAREKLDQVQVKTNSMLVVPVEIAVFDPSRKEVKKKDQAKGNAWVRGNVLLRGEKTDFAIDVQYEPKSFWLDRKQEVFGRFYNESRNPKRVLFFQGVDAAAAGKAEEAEALFGKALAAEVETTPDPENPRDKSLLKRDGRWLDAQIDLSRARLYLDQGKAADAQAAFDRAYRVLAPFGGWTKEELKILEARLEMARGDYDKAFKRLRKGLLRGGLDSTEGYVLLAIAAKATSHREEFDEAMKTARENGADVTVLAGV
jgi:peptidase M1-like protein